MKLLSEAVVQGEVPCWAALAGRHMKALVLYIGLTRIIHLNQSLVHVSLLLDDFLFTKMAS